MEQVRVRAATDLESAVPGMEQRQAFDLLGEGALEKRVFSVHVGGDTSTDGDLGIAGLHG
jgi:hypothetical protein